MILFLLNQWINQLNGTSNVDHVAVGESILAGVFASEEVFA